MCKKKKKTQNPHIRALNKTPLCYLLHPYTDNQKLIAHFGTRNATRCVATDWWTTFSGVYKSLRRLCEKKNRLWTNGDQRWRWFAGHRRDDAWIIHWFCIRVGLGRLGSGKEFDNNYYKKWRKIALVWQFLLNLTWFQGIIVAVYFAQ